MSGIAIHQTAMIRGPLLAATAVSPMPPHGQIGHWSGTAMLQVHAALCWPFISAGDVLNVDFDRRQVDDDGCYLLLMDDARPGEAPYSRRWFGARQFQHMPSGLYVREETLRDGQQWIPATPAMMARFTVFGLVLDVFKSVKAKGAKPAAASLPSEQGASHG